MAIKEKLSKTQKQPMPLSVEESSSDIQEEIPKEQTPIVGQTEEIPEVKETKLENSETASKIEVEINNEWIDCKEAGLGFAITGVRSSEATARVKTTNGWFDETDPKKAPVLFVEIPGMLLSAHVKGGEWLPMQADKVGCGVAIDAIAFSEEK